MIEKWKESVVNGGAFGALMTDLSKAFDYLQHGILIAKFDTCVVDIKPLKFIQQYLTNTKQNVKVGNIVHGKKFLMIFHRGQFLVHLFSISFCVTYFISRNAL